MRPCAILAERLVRGLLTVMRSCVILAVDWVQAVIMASLRHPNVCMLLGICLDPPCLVTEWCSRGSLYDVIARAARRDPKSPPLDWMRSLSMALDASKVDSPCTCHLVLSAACIAHEAHTPSRRMQPWLALRLETTRAIAGKHARLACCR